MSENKKREVNLVNDIIAIAEKFEKVLVNFKKEFLSQSN